MESPGPRVDDRSGERNPIRSHIVHGRIEALIENRGLPDIQWFKWSSQKPHGHPAEKPVHLMRWCVKHSPLGVVLDPFMGSGTTLVAAKLEGRKAVGIELEERYCEIAAKRLAQGVLF